MVGVQRRGKAWCLRPAGTTTLAHRECPYGHLGWSLRSWLSSEKVIPRERMRTAVVERGHFVRDVAATGLVVAAVSPTLYATATGTVSLKVHAGDAVTRGQTVAVLDSPGLTANLSQEEATLESDRLDWQRGQPRRLPSVGHRCASKPHGGGPRSPDHREQRPARCCGPPVFLRAVVPGR